MSDLQIEPGQKLTNREREALRKDNEKASINAQRQAAEQRNADVRSGQRPVLQEVADRLKEKLAGEEFSKR